MEELIKNMKEMSKSFDKVMKEEIGYTMEEMLKLEGEEFSKVSNDFVEKVLNKMTEKNITKEDVKEKEDGQFFKIYEASTKYGTGVVVEAQGKVGDVLYFITKGVGQFIAQNKYKFKDIDDLVDTLCENIKNEIKGGN